MRKERGIKKSRVEKKCPVSECNNSNSNKTFSLYIKRYKTIGVKSVGFDTKDELETYLKKEGLSSNEIMTLYMSHGYLVKDGAMYLAFER